MSAFNPHPAAQVLADYCAGRLPASEALTISDHLLGCPACRTVLSDAVTGFRSHIPGSDLPSTLPDAPLDYEEMVALLEGSLNEAQSEDVRARLATSPLAATEFTDLQRFHGESEALPPRLHGPAPVPSGEIGDSVEATNLLQFPRRRWTYFVAWAAAAAILLCAGGWWLAGSRLTPGTVPLWADADLASLPDDLHRSVERASQTGVVEVSPLLAALRPAPGTLAGAAPQPSGFRQIGPVGIVVRGQQPSFRWTQCDQATSYVLYVVDASGQAPMVRQEVPGNRTEWAPATPLPRGTVYEWQVEARRGSEIIDRAPRPPAPETRFEVLDEAQTAELVRLEGRYAQNPLILGTAYTRAGLEEMAGQQFALLAHKYPRSTIARRLQEAHAGVARRE